MRSSSLATTGRVFGALMLRDVQTRFGAKSANYVIAILWPLTHIAVILLIHAYAGREVPVGDSAALFFSTGLIPFVMFNYLSRWTMMGVMMNRPLLGLPIIKFTDLLLSRTILESISSFAVILLFGFILYASDVKIIPREPDTAAIALGCTLLMCIGFGIINGVLGMITPFWMFGSIGIIIICYITSGVVFVPDQLPQKIQNILSWNPLLQSITWFRSAYYPGLGAHILDRQYLLIFSLVSIGFGLALERILRPFILNA